VSTNNITLPNDFPFPDSARTQVDCAALRIVHDWPKLPGVSMAGAMVLVLFRMALGAGRNDNINNGTIMGPNESMIGRKWGLPLAVRSHLLGRRSLVRTE
jgi:hypothetical protein